VAFSKSSETTTAERIAWSLHAAAALHREEARYDLIAFFEAFDNFSADAISNPRLNFKRLQFGAFALRRRQDIYGTRAGAFRPRSSG
jgi:hypothetical protein